LLRRFGLPSTATESDLKQAYFMAAKLLHPDVAKGQNGTRFVEASAAYEEARNLLRKHSKKDESSRQTGQGPQGSCKYDPFHNTAKDQQSNSDNASNDPFQAMQPIFVLLAGLWYMHGPSIVSTAHAAENCAEIKGYNSARATIQRPPSSVPQGGVSEYYRARSHKKNKEDHDWIRELEIFHLNDAFLNGTHCDNTYLSRLCPESSRNKVVFWFVAHVIMTLHCSDDTFKLRLLRWKLVLVQFLYVLSYSGLRPCTSNSTIFERGRKSWRMSLSHLFNFLYRYSRCSICFIQFIQQWALPISFFKIYVLWASCLSVSVSVFVSYILGFP